MNTYTPGPWELREEKQEKIISSWHIHIGDDQIQVFPYKSIYSADRQQSGLVMDDTKLADVQLIAAAPDLLEALKDMGARYGLNELAYEAIAKAEGEKA